MKVYLTVNTIILPSELYDALELVRQAYRAGVDAFIVQDLGLAQEIARTIPQTRVHISTQMNTHTKDALVAEAALGAKRVTLAREPFCCGARYGNGMLRTWRALRLLFGAVLHVLDGGRT